MTTQWKTELLSTLQRRSAILAVLAAIAIKAAFLFIVIPMISKGSPGNYQIELFPDGYDLIAQNLLDGNGYRLYPDMTLTMARTPGFVLVLAGIFFVFGHSLAATQIFNILFSVIGAGFTFATARQLSGNRSVGTAAALISFFHPASMLADSRGGLESFLSMCIMVTIWLTYRAFSTGRVRDYVLAGLAFGVVLLVKSTAALFPPLLFAILWLRRRNVAGLLVAIRSVTAFGIAAVLIFSPWIIRNYQVSHQLVLTMTNGAPTAYQGFYVAKHWGSGHEHYALIDEAVLEQEALARKMNLQFRGGFFQQFYTPQDELAFSRRLYDLTLQQYRNDMMLIWRAFAFNLRGFWIQGRTARATRLNELVVLPFLALVAVGGYIALRRRLDIGPLLLFVVGFVAAHLPVMGVARYQVPVLPLLSVIAAMAALPLLERFQRSGQRLPNSSPLITEHVR